MLVQNDEIVNIEVAAEDVSLQRLRRTAFTHTNHYLSPKMVQYEKFHTASSLHRYDRACGLLSTCTSIAGVKSLLSDTADSRYPICREKETIASIIMLPQKREMYVCRGHPCAGTYKKYTL